MGIHTGKSLITAKAGLRRHAEEQLHAKAANLLPRSVEETQRLVHELEVHQIELEIQNEELLQAREELELSRNKYAELYDFAPIGYFIFDVRGVIKEVNLAGAHMLGIQRQSLTNRPFTNFIADAVGKEIFPLHLESVMQKPGMQRCEIRVTGKDGTVLYGRFESVMLDTIGSKEGFILCSIVDGTADKQLEAEIQNAREYAENIVETLREPIVVLNSELKILTANHSFYDTFKVTPDETIGNFICNLGNRQWDIPKLRVLVEEILTHDTVINGYEVQHDFPGIGRKTILLNARQIFREDIGSHIILLAMEDITKRKAADEEIVRLNTSLALRAADLEDVNRELEAFNYTVAHDLRNPLNIVSSYCQAVKEMCGSALDEKCRRYLQEAYDGTMRMNRLIEALLNFSRLTHATLNRDMVDLSFMAKEAAEELKGMEASRRVTFLIADGMCVNGDPNLLRVVLVNLLGNAWKYTGMREEAVIEFGAKEIDGEPVYFVRDNGAGFDNADAGKLFIPFQRLPGVEECRGFGIGLATVERIIRRHGGRVWAEGNPDKGATFYFTLQT
ncbi:MAG: ATP-binding protein [Desulfuromonadaceae bacterium]